jgi:hypothetical protein
VAKQTTTDGRSDIHHPNQLGNHPVTLYQPKDGLCQFAEQHFFRDDLAQWLASVADPETRDWVNLIPSGLYDDLETAKK